VPEIKDIFSNVAQKVVDSVFHEKSKARVIKSKEGLNLCDIIYKDSRSRIIKKENVFVACSDVDKWFPREGDLVDIEIFEDYVCIIGKKLDSTSFLKAKSNWNLSNDIYPDDSDGTIGNVLS
jgi:hypothetical protein